MSYRLPTPLTSMEADLISTEYVFTRVDDGEYVWAEFASEITREAAAQTLRAHRMGVWRASLEVNAPEPA